MTHVEDDLTPSKSDRKRSVDRLQLLGERLAKLSPRQLNQLPLDDALREAIAELNRLTAHEAIRRQRQYVGKLMRHVDEATLLQALATQGQPQQQKRLINTLERLIQQGDAAVSEVLQRFPHADRHTVRQQVRQAQQSLKQAQDLPEAEKTQAIETARARLLRYLQSLAALSETANR